MKLSDFKISGQSYTNEREAYDNWKYDSNEPSLLDEVDRIFGDVPDEVWDQLPTDLSVNHDHYIYGLPKRWNPETGKWFDEEKKAENV